MRYRVFATALTFGVACKSIGTPGGSRPESSAVRADAARETDAGSDGALSGAAKPRAPRAFSVLFEGECSAGPAHKLGQTLAFVTRQSVVALHDDGPKVLFRSTARVNMTGAAGISSYLSDLGGVDEAHAWVIEQLPTRGGDTSGEPRFAARNWRPGPALSQATMGFGYYLSHFIENADGSLWAFGSHDIYMVAGEPERKTFAWSKDGEFLKVSLPGADMEGGSRIANGEIVAAGRGKGGKPKLLRWSPRAPVDDITVGDAPSSQATSTLPVLQVGTKTAVMAVPDGGPKKLAFYRYDGEKLVALRLNGERSDIVSWFVAADDAVFAASSDKYVYIEDASGSSVREELPEPGAWVAGAGAPWWKATSGELYRREGTSWVKVTLPDSPWAKPGHPAYKVQWVRTFGDETLVGASRTDVGYAAQDKKPKVVTTVFSDARARAPMRCGYPLKPDELGPMP